MARVGHDRRLRAYARLSRLLFPRSYAGKILLLAFVATHTPLVALVVYLLLAADLDRAHAGRVLLVALLATLAGAGLAVGGLWALLAPVVAASRALGAYRVGRAFPALPTDLADEGGRLMADVQATLTHLDEAVGHLAALAAQDDLTGLLNRREGERRLREDLAATGSEGRVLAVVALDADGLKAVNDRWGHAAGDACLRHLAAALARHLGPAGWVARWGGDEFLAVLPEAAGAPSVEAALARLAGDLASDPARLPGGEEVALGVSWGVARSVADEPPEALVARADAALYQAKRARRGRVGAAEQELATSSAGSPSTGGEVHRR